MSKRSCRDVRADLSAYLDGDLEAGPAGEIRIHLEGCAACRSELELLHHTVGALRRLPELQPPAGILAGVRARMRPQPWYRRLFGGGLLQVNFPHRLPIGAAATLLVVLGISFLVARYPEMHKTASRDFSPQTPKLPEPRVQAKPAPIAHPSPEARVAGAERQTAAPAPARRPPQAGWELESSTPPQVASRVGETAAFRESASGAGARDRNAASPASPVAPVAPVEPVEPAGPVKPIVATGITTHEAKVDQVRPQLPASALKDTLREEAPSAESHPASSFGDRVDKSEPEIERSPEANATPQAQSAGADSLSKRGLAHKNDLDGQAPTNLLSAAKGEPRAAIDRKAESSSDRGYARLAMKKEKAAASRIEIVCLLRPDGDTVEDLIRLLRREGAVDIELVALEPPALRERFARHRERLGTGPGALQGWTITARVQAPALARLLETLAGRTGLLILEQTAVPPTREIASDPLDLRITIAR